MNNFYIKVIQEAMDYDHLLSEWEFNFINDLAERGDDYELSEKQKSVLNKISTKVATG